MEVGISFADIKSYIENMSKGLDDKLFFLNRINFTDGRPYLFVDFGCADGVLLTALYNILSAKGVHAYYIGYDISEAMIDLAKNKFDSPTDCVMFTSNWGDVEEKLNKWSKMVSVLILSSVIHEVYSYAKDGKEIEDFWDKIHRNHFNYVCIRDMMVSQDINRKPNPEITDKVAEKIRFGTTLSRLVRSYQKRWGKNIYLSNQDLVHFLLKYRWVINWDREVNENYFPIYLCKLLEKFSDTHNINYFERFRVPFLDKCLKEDFDIELEDFTHVKVIFELKREVSE